MKRQIKDSNFIHAIGFKLRRIRQLSGLSQEKVIEDTKINIARIERGELNFSISTFSFLLNYYSITASEFFNEGFEDFESSFSNNKSDI